MTQTTNPQSHTLSPTNAYDARASSSSERASLVAKLYTLFAPGERYKLTILMVMMAVGAGFEALGIGLVMPFIALLSTPDALTSYPFMGSLFETLGLSEQRQVLAAAGAMLLAVYMLKNLYLTLMYYIKFKTIFDQQVKLSRRLLGAYMFSPYMFHVERNSAELLRNVNEEVRLVFVHSLHPALTLAIEAMVVGVLGLILLTIAPAATLVSASFLGVFILGFYLSIRARITRLGKEQQHQYAQMIKSVNQALGGIKETKIAARERPFLDRFTVASRAYANAVAYNRIVSVLPRHFVEAISVGGMLLIVVVLLWGGHELTRVLPILGLFAMSAFRMMPSFNRIIGSMTHLKHHLPSLEVVYQDLVEMNLHDRDLDFDESSEPFAFEDAITFDRVTFSYPTAHKPVLEDLSLTIQKGESVAFVGASGAGKTTAVDVLLGLYSPSSGRIMVDGQDIAGEERGWRRHISYITQPVYMLDDTVRQNIAFCLPDDDIDDDRVWRALDEAQLGDFVRELPGQLEHVIGEHGVKLSGGQRQRLGIARALYGDPDVMVLDEATSALDNETEREITRTIQALHGSRTLVTIAHRLSTVKNCDRIFFLKDGRVSAEGSFADLYDLSEDFKRLVDAAEDTSDHTSTSGT